AKQLDRIADRRLAEHGVSKGCCRSRHKEGLARRFCTRHFGKQSAPVLLPWNTLPRGTTLPPRCCQPPGATLAVSIFADEFGAVGHRPILGQTFGLKPLDPFDCVV